MRGFVNHFAVVATTLLLGFAASADATRMAARPREPDCAFPAPGNRDRIMIVGVDSNVVSSVAMGSRDDVTYVSRVAIEAGVTPLYLVLVSGEPRIWIFSGATQRVRHVALIAGTPSRVDHTSPPAGAVGLPVRKVSAHFRCHGVPGAFAPADSEHLRFAREEMTRALGRTPEILDAQGGTSVTLPAGRVRAYPDLNFGARPPGFDPLEWREVRRFHAGGLVQINPAHVVGGEALEYDVLPQEFGLAQLVATGALRRAPGSTLHDPIYHVVRPIARIPAGLSGGHRVRFEVQPGVPRPAGDIGHSCLVMPRQNEDEDAVCQRRDHN